MFSKTQLYSQAEGRHELLISREVCSRPPRESASLLALPRPRRHGLAPGLSNCTVHMQNVRALAE